MSLTATDLQDIRSIVYDVISPLENEIKALRSDIEEIYNMIAELRGTSLTDKDFKKLSLEQKLLTLNTELLIAAKEAGINLPRELA
jgi:NurA-like 5'-3' nuclease